MPSATKRRAMERDRRTKQYRTWGIVAGVVVVVAIAAVLLSQGSSGGDTVTGETQPVTIEGQPLPTFNSAAASDPAVGEQAPTIVGKSFDGSPVTIDPGSTGRPTAIWFVAHWCPHCNAEVPRIVDLQSQGALPSNVDYYAVSTGVNAQAPNYPPSTWLTETEHWPFPALADDDANTAAKAYGLPSYPYLVLIDAEGNVVARHAGELGDAGIVPALQQIAG